MEVYMEKVKNWKHETFSFFSDDTARLLDVAQRLGMNKSAVVRLALHVIAGHVKAVQGEISRSLKPNEDFQHVFQRQILNDFDFMMSGRVKLNKPKKSLEELKKTQIDLF